MSAAPGIVRPRDLGPLRAEGIPGGAADRGLTALTSVAAAVAALAFFALAAALLVHAGRFLLHAPLADVLLSSRWSPSGAPAAVGIWGPLLATLAAATGALVLAAPIGIGASVTLAEIAPRALGRLMRPAIEGLAALPAVVVGWIGILLVAPLFEAAIGRGPLAAALSAASVLALMAIPTVAALSQEALAAVPSSRREASLALGADRWETTWRVVVPHAAPRMAGAVLIAAGRVLGEGIAVLLVAGASGALPQGDAMRTPPAARTLAAAVAEGAALVGGPGEGAVFLAGALLLAMTLAARALGAALASRARAAAGGAA